MLITKTNSLNERNISEAKFKLTRNFLVPSRIIGYLQALGNLGLYLFLLWISSQVENGVGLLLIFFLIGISLNRLFFPVHDCIHLSLFPTKRENQICGSILASFLGTTFASISSQHFDHHKNFGLPSDPGASDYYVKFSSRREYLFFIVSPLFGSIFLKQMADYLTRPSRSLNIDCNKPIPKEKFSVFIITRRYAPIIIFQIFAFSIVTNGFTLSELWRYPVFVVLPAITVFLFLNRLRMFLEHGSIDYAVSDYFLNKNPITRTIYASTIEKILICGSDFNYHHEHHLYPGVPGHQLPRLHAELLKFGYEDESVRNTYTESFLELWRNLGVRPS